MLSSYPIELLPYEPMFPVPAERELMRTSWLSYQYYLSFYSAFFPISLSLHEAQS